jgi:flagellar biosynthesis component FlhA
MYGISHLINKLTAVNIVVHEDLGPQIRLATFDKVASLLLEHRVIIRDRN